MEPFSITVSLKVADTVVEPLTQCCLSIREHHLRMFVFEYYGELEVTGYCGLLAVLVRRPKIKKTKTEMSWERYKYPSRF